MPEQRQSRKHAVTCYARASSLCEKVIEPIQIICGYFSESPGSGSISCLDRSLGLLQVAQHVGLEGSDVLAQPSACGRLLPLQAVNPLVHIRRAAGEMIDLSRHFVDLRGPC